MTLTIVSLTGRSPSKEAPRALPRNWPQTGLGEVSGSLLANCRPLGERVPLCHGPAKSRLGDLAGLVSGNGCPQQANAEVMAQVPLT
jgi:hypothetical protein